MIPFVKMHGIGNDYIYLDAVADPALATMDGLSAFACRISDRHTGVGADGLILVCHPSDAGREAGAQVRMRMFNADGSESAMCGNGVRCVAKFAHDRLNHTGPSILVETSAGTVSTRVTLDSSGRVDTVCVDMGVPELEARRIPVMPKKWGNSSASGRAVDLPVDQLGIFAMDAGFAPDKVEPLMCCVSMGNPHVVLWCNDPWEIDLETVGPLIENDPVFPSRVNVHLAARSSKSKVIMRTWERGTGITQACGSGACAVVVAGVLAARLDRSVRVGLPGGDLDIEWMESTGRVLMTGPAREVYAGTWPINEPPPLVAAPTLATARFTLRPLAHSDVPALTAILNDKRMSETMLTVPFPYTSSHAASWVSARAFGHTNSLNTVWGISETASQALIGTIGISFGKHNSAEIGYWTAIQWWGKGVASEALAEVLRYCFQQKVPPLQRVEAHHFMGNDASGSVMRKAGMRCECVCRAGALKHGRQIDVVRYAISRDEWLSRTESGAPVT